MKQKYEDLSNEAKEKVDAYECAIEDMYQAMDDFENFFGDSIADQIRADALDEAFSYIKDIMHECKKLLISNLAESEAGNETAIQ